jgi:hypothetical protein
MFNFSEKMVPQEQYDVLKAKFACAELQVHQQVEDMASKDKELKRKEDQLIEMENVF